MHDMHGFLPLPSPATRVFCRKADDACSGGGGKKRDCLRVDKVQHQQQQQRPILRRSSRVCTQLERKPHVLYRGDKQSVAGIQAHRLFRIFLNYRSYTRHRTHTHTHTHTLTHGGGGGGGVGGCQSLCKSNTTANFSAEQNEESMRAPCRQCTFNIHSHTRHLDSGGVTR